MKNPKETRQARTNFLGGIAKMKEVVRKEVRRRNIAGAMACACAVLAIPWRYETAALVLGVLELLFCWGWYRAWLRMSRRLKIWRKLICHSERICVEDDYDQVLWHGRRAWEACEELYPNPLNPTFDQVVEGDI